MFVSNCSLELGFNMLDAFTMIQRHMNREVERMTLGKPHVMQSQAIALFHSVMCFQ